MPIPAIGARPAVFVSFPPVRTAMIMSIVGGVNLGVPAILDEIHRHAACPVTSATVSPVFFFTRAYAQIDRGGGHVHWRRLHENRLGIDHLGAWVRADIHLPIEARLANTDGNTDICCYGCLHRKCDGTRRKQAGSEKAKGHAESCKVKMQCRPTSD